MNEIDLFLKFNNDEEFKMYDFTPIEIEEMINKTNFSKNFKEKYFDFYDDIKSHTKKGPQDW